MRCSSCRRNDAAVFVRLFPGAHVLLCRRCLDHINVQVLHRLREEAVVQMSRTRLAHRPSSAAHLLSHVLVSAAQKTSLRPHTSLDRDI